MHFQELNERMQTTEPKYIQDAIAGYLEAGKRLFRGASVLYGYGIAEQGAP